MYKQINEIMHSSFTIDQISTHTTIPRPVLEALLANHDATHTDAHHTLTLAHIEELITFWETHKHQDYGYIHQLVTDALMYNHHLYHMACTKYHTQDHDTLITQLTHDLHEYTQQNDTNHIDIEHYLYQTCDTHVK